jgi:hypothetical protein
LSLKTGGMNAASNSEEIVPTSADLVQRHLMKVVIIDGLTGGTLFPGNLSGRTLSRATFSAA